LTNGEAFSKLASPNRSGSGEGPLLPDVSSPLSDLQLAGLIIGRKKKGKIMYTLINFKTMTPRRRNSISTAVAGLLTVLLCFALSPTPNAFGVTPAPDGDYPGFNTAEGEDALFSLTTGVGNTANGAFALFHNTTGDFNTANGWSALSDNQTGRDNTAMGEEALSFNTTGGQNTAIGVDALADNTTGSSNIALGNQAGVVLTTGDNNIDIGNKGVKAEANTIRIGTKETHTATFIAGISGKTASGGVAVYVNANGKLGTTVSSARFKEQIKPMDKASEAIHALKPVTFRYKQELDPEGIPQFGLLAEQVEKVNPDLVARDDQGKVYTVRYDAVNAMLLNEFLKEHRKGQEQDATIADLKSTIAEQQKQIEALIAGLRKVSAQLELNKPAPQMVLNNQ
jgi:hypothetical protein